MREAFVGFVFVFCLGALGALAENKGTGAGKGKEPVVATLSKDQIQEFATLVRIRDLRREELIVTTRIWGEKQRELKAFVDEMSKEFGMSPQNAYTYDIASKSLYQLSTNKVDKAGKPERTLARKIKTESEAKYVSRLMVARKLTEQQIVVLAQLREEKMKEAKLQDEKLRKTFNLDPEGGYRLDEKTGEVFRLPKPEKAAAPAPAGDAKKPAKK